MQEVPKIEKTTKIDKIKQHFKENRELYVAATASATVATIVVTALWKRSWDQRTNNSMATWRIIHDQVRSGNDFEYFLEDGTALAITRADKLTK